MLLNNIFNYYDTLSFLIVRALSLGLFITSDELEIILEKAINLLKTILLPYAFFGCGPQVGLMVFLTDDSSAERNALELYWPQGNIPIFIFFIFSMYFFYVIV